jgi:hypothetical protein
MKVYTGMEQVVSTNLLIREYFPANMIHNERDDKETLNGAKSNYLLCGVIKTASEKLRAKLSVSVTSSYKTFFTREDVRSMFLRRVGTKILKCFGSCPKKTVHIHHVNFVSKKARVKGSVFLCSPRRRVGEWRYNCPHT